MFLFLFDQINESESESESAARLKITVLKIINFIITSPGHGCMDGRHGRVNVTVQRESYRRK